MTANVLECRLDVIDKLKYLSECIDKKCEDISKAPDSGTTLERLLKLCIRIRKNCEAFEEILLREEVCNDSSNKHNLVITLHLLDIIGAENCGNLKNDQINKFKADLEIFTKNYLLQTSDPVFLNLYQLFHCDSRTENLDSKENQESDPLEQINCPEILPFSLNSSNELNLKGDVSITDVVQNKLLLPSDRPVEIEETQKNEDTAGPSDQPDNTQNLNLLSSTNGIEEHLSAGKPTETEENQKNENAAVISEDIEENLKQTDIENQSSEKNSLDSHQENTVNSNSEESNIENSTNLENAKACSSKSIEDNLENTHTKNISTDSGNQEDKPKECGAPSIDSSEDVEKKVNKECTAVCSGDLENVEKSKEASSNSSVHTKESINESNIENPSAETHNLDEPCEEIDSIPAQSSQFIDENLENGVGIKPTEFLDENQALPSNFNDKNSVKESFSGNVNSSEEQSSSDQTLKGELSSELQCSPIVFSTHISEGVENEKNEAKEEDAQSEQFSKDLDSNIIREIDSNQKVSEENSTHQQFFLTQLGLAKTTNYKQIRTMRDELLDILDGKNCDEGNSIIQNVRKGLDTSSSESSDHEEKYSEGRVTEALNGLEEELLEILDEENCDEGNSGIKQDVRKGLDTSSSESSDDEEKYSESKVADALKELEEDSLSDLGIVSDSELDLSSIDDLLLYGISDSDDNDKDIQEERRTSIENFIAKRCHVILERNNLKKMQQDLQSTTLLASVSKHASKGCYVVLELMKICQQIEDKADDENDQYLSTECKDLDSNQKSVDEDAAIDRLCQLPTFNRKRCLSNEERTKRKIKRKRRSINLSGTETSDLSGYSSVSDNEVRNERLVKYEMEEEDDNLPLDPNTLLTEIVCHTIHDSDSDSSATSSYEEDKERRKRRKIDNIKMEEDVKIKKEKEDSWKDDPLLRGNLNVPSEMQRKSKDDRKRMHDSDVESNEPRKIKKKNRSKFLDPDYCESSSTNSSDDSEDDFMGVTKEEKKGDSDVEIVNSTISNIINVDSEEEIDDKNESRRKIKSVLSSRNLTEETQRAAEEEKARMRKLEEQKLMRCSQESQSTEDNALVLDVSPDGTAIAVDPNLSEKLFSHQIEGIKFMWESCYLSVESLKTFQGTGCILAHNMGLGKTFQVVTLVHTLFNHPFTNTKRVLIVCPLSTVSGWKREFQNALKMVKKTKDIKISAIRSKDDRSMKSYILNKWRRDGGVMIIGYDAFSRLTKDDDSVQTKEIREALVNPGPDLVVCDEAHVLKNGQSMRTKALMEIRTKRRIALTGTPLQNNLKEYYFMVQFVKPNLLGNKKEFNRQFVNPIMNGQYEDSREYDITLMKKRTHVLHRLLKNTVQRYEATELKKYLQNMQDYAIFIQLHPLQEKLYKTYIETRKKAMMGQKNIKSFFNDYQILKYICSHPQLLHTMEAQNAQRKRNVVHEREIISQEPEVIEFDGIPQDWWKIDCSDDIKTNLEFGTKLQVMMAIIEEAEKIGEKVLIFTSSLVELSSVEYFMKLKGTPKCSSWKPKRDYFRMDGTVPPSIRTEMCDMFNDENNKTMRVFLMSHKVGGLGLNLTAANRVILLGANFNPSLDSQSIYRAYRFGQTKMVYIYRLLSMGTMEEKIYNRCITKLAIASRVVDKHQITRHYKNLDLEDLYNIEIDLSLQRPTPTKPDDDVLSSILLKYECIHKFHHHQKLLENRPDEDLNEEDQRKAWEEFEAMVEREKNGPQNSLAAKKIELVQNQWNELHRLPPMLKPLQPSNIQELVSNLRNQAAQGTTSKFNTINQPTDGTTSQARTGFIPSTPTNTSRIPRYFEAENMSKVQSTNVGESHIANGDINLAKNRTVNNMVGVSTRTDIPQTSSSISNYPTPRRLSEIKKIDSNRNGEGHLTAGTTSHITDGTTSHSKNDTYNQSNGVATISDRGRTALINATAQILHNLGYNASQADKNKLGKKKSTAIGPNPLVLARLQHRKENLTSNPNKANWRASSSDDFQRPSSSNISSARKTKSKVSNASTSERRIDSNVICIDISDESPSGVQVQLAELRKRNLTITTTPARPKKNEIPPIIDIT